LAATLFSSLN